MLWGERFSFFQNQDVNVRHKKPLCGTLGTDLGIYHWPFCSFYTYWKGRNESAYIWRIQNGLPTSITTELSMTSTSKIWHHSINTWLRTQHRILWYSRVILTSHHGSFIAHYVGHNVQEWHFDSRLLPSPGSVISRISPVACLLQYRSGSLPATIFLLALIAKFISRVCMHQHK